MEAHTKGYTDLMKDIPKIYFNLSCDWLKDKIFCSKESWESEHVLDSAQHTHSILDHHYKNLTWERS